MTTKLKPVGNIIKMSDSWVNTLLGQIVKGPDGKDWVVIDYDSEQLWFVPVSLGQKYIERGNPSLRN